MLLFAAIVCTTFFGTGNVLGQNQEPSSLSPSISVVKIPAVAGQKVPELTMTREDDLKEVEVSIPQKYLDKIKEKGILRPMWRVEIEVEEKVEGSQGHERKNTSGGSNRTLLNVLIGRGQDTVYFQLPRSDASNRSKKISFDSALNRSIDICPGQHINANSTLRIQLASLSPIVVNVRTTLAEEGGGWNLLADQGEEPRMEIESQFWFSNPLIHTVRFDQILRSAENDISKRSCEGESY